MNILLVDDDEVIRMGMHKLIEKAGREWKVCGEFSDGAMALDYLESHSDIDLIICDVRMPIMDGLVLTQTIREKKYENPKVIMLSGYNDFEYVRSAFMNGACDYILKPFKKDELIALIEKVELQISYEVKNRMKRADNVEFIVTEILRKLSSCSREEIPDHLERLRDLGINTGAGFFMALRIVADQYYRQFSKESQYTKALMDCLEMITSKAPEIKGVQYISCTLGKEILILAFAPSREKADSFAPDLFEKLNPESSEKSVTIGISGISENSEDIPKLFNEAKRAVMGRFYLGQHRLIGAFEVEDKTLELKYDVNPAAEKLTHHVTLCDYMGAKQVMDSVFLDLSYCSEDLFRQYIQRLLEVICADVPAFGSFVSANEPETGFCIEYLNTYRELKTFMSSLLKNAIDYMMREKEQKSERRIEMAKDYIARHYSEPFTLTEIAEYVELNASYFSNLFKTETGMNFSEYLLNVRMDKAKELLKDPKIRIYEIGQLVGYEDAVSFGRAFKKKWGISPKEYRNLVY